MKLIDLILTSKIINSWPPPSLNVNWRYFAQCSIDESPLTDAVEKYTTSLHLPTCITSRLSVNEPTDYVAISYKVQ